MTPSIYERIAQQGRVDEAIDKCEKDIYTLKNSCAHLEHADALHSMAQLLKYYKSDYVKGLNFLRLEIGIRLTKKLPGLDSAYLKSAILNSYLENKESAIKYANLALTYTNNGKIKGTALNVLGDAIFRTRPDDSAEYFEEAKLLFIAEEDEYNLSHVNLSIARIVGFNKKIDSALTICQNELDKGLNSQNQGIVGTAYLRFAEIYKFNNELKKSN